MTGPHVWDLCEVLEGLHAKKLDPMNDPRGASSRIQACPFDSSREEAMSKPLTAKVRARKALDAYKNDKEADTFYYLDQLFGGKFPAR
jgi:hypothetical protein